MLLSIRFFRRPAAVGSFLGVALVLAAAPAAWAQSADASDTDAALQGSWKYLIGGAALSAPEY